MGQVEIYDSGGSEKAGLAGEPQARRKPDHGVSQVVSVRNYAITSRSCAVNMNLDPVRDFAQILKQPARISGIAGIHGSDYGDLRGAPRAEAI